MGNEASAPVTYGTRLLNDVEVEWKKAELSVNLPSRDGHSAATAGNKLYIFGGVRWLSDVGEVTESNEILVFDAESNSLRKILAGGEVPQARSSAAMAAVGNKLYVFGGLSRDCGWLNDLHSFDTETKQWQKITGEGNPPCPRDKLSCVAMGTKILLFGGFGPLENAEANNDEQEMAEFGWFDDLYSFDTGHFTWRKLTPAFAGCPTPRAAFGMCAVGSKLVIFGGRDSMGRKNDLFVLDTETMEWVSKPFTGRQPKPRSFHSCTAIGSRVVVFGGRSAENTHFDDFHIFDTDTFEWLKPATTGSKPPARGVHTATVVGNWFVVYGGSSDLDDETMQCQEYYGDIHMIDKEKLLSGKCLGPDPSDVQQVMPLQVGADSVDGAQCGTIEEEEEDTSEYDESSDEQLS